VNGHLMNDDNLFVCNTVMYLGRNYAQDKLSFSQHPRLIQELPFPHFELCEMLSGGGSLNFDSLRVFF
jgi:hypothetical protein